MEGRTPETAPEPIVCKVTPWFLLRAVAMLAMFGIFAYLFYYDGSVGYREKNRIYYTYKTFEAAGHEAVAKEDTAESWEAYAAGQSLRFPDNMALLPEGTDANEPWPEELFDHEMLKEGKWHQLWERYTGRHELDADAPENPMSEGEIREQWIALGVCLALAAVTLFFLIRTLRRKMIADDEALTVPDGRRIPYGEISRIDLRQWTRKGLALVFYPENGAERKARIDGLTYGGFKEDQGAPAEKLMQRVLSHFSGEVIEYTEEEPVEDEAAPASPSA